jgi:lipoprotein-anchoring transpeptidase ErfK/SrfK
MISRRSLLVGFSVIALSGVPCAADAETFLQALEKPKRSIAKNTRKFFASILPKKPSSRKAKVKKVSLPKNKVVKYTRPRATKLASNKKPAVETINVLSYNKTDVQPAGIVASNEVITSNIALQTPQPTKIDTRFEPQQVQFSNSYKVGTIVVNSNESFLYLVTGPGTARRYGIFISNDALAWKGTATIKSKVEWPAWKPKVDILKRNPALYALYKGGVPGGPDSPLGARALYLYKGESDTSLSIHGTTQSPVLGASASNGGFRMNNEHVIDLFSRVPVNTEVVVF